VDWRKCKRSESSYFVGSGGRKVNPKSKERTQCQSSSDTIGLSDATCLEVNVVSI